MYNKTRICMLLTILSVHPIKIIASHQQYPGTKTRPVLSEAEASRYVKENYLSGWVPQEIVIPDEPDYTVRAGESIQQVVNEAIISGKDQRTYIRINPGIYRETVYVMGNVSLTIYGGGDSPSDVVIVQNISANIHAPEYIDLVNSNGSRYKKGDPAWEIYSKCARKSGSLGSCCAVFWIASDGFQLTRLTVQNAAIDAQSVAIKVDASEVYLMTNNFLGAQDTLYMGTTAEAQLIYVHMCYVEGDTDFICGQGAAVFDRCIIKVIGVRRKNSGVIFAPNTPAKRSFGFLVINSTLTGDKTFIGSSKIHLARAWDTGIKSAEDYVPGVSPNGQLVIRETQIDNVIDPDQPYTSAASSGRVFSSNIDFNRNLDDNTYNRMWEFDNHGDSA